MKRRTCTALLSAAAMTVTAACSTAVGSTPDRSARALCLAMLPGRTIQAWQQVSVRDLWNYQHKDEARRHWQVLQAWAIRSRLKPVIKVARMIQAHLENVLTFC